MYSIQVPRLLAHEVYLASYNKLVNTKGESFAGTLKQVKAITRSGVEVFEPVGRVFKRIN